MKICVYHWMQGKLPFDWKQNEIVDVVPSTLMYLLDTYDLMLSKHAAERDLIMCMFDDKGKRFKTR
jgi:hypothetical protein